MPMIKLPKLPDLAIVDAAVAMLHDRDNMDKGVAEFALSTSMLLSELESVRDKIRQHGSLAQDGPPFTNGFMLGYLVAMGWGEAD